SWNGTRSSASSVAMATSPSGVRAEHTWGGSGPCRDRVAGCERARSGVYRARVDGAKSPQAVTLTVALGNLTGGAVETSVIPSSPLTATESRRPPRAHGPP